MKTSSFHGLLVLDKPGGITSREALDRAAGWFPRKTKIGHTGTLDPLATGVLVLCLGHASRLVEYVQDMPKVYRTQLFLGARSDTDDAEGTITPVADAPVPERAVIERALESFVGVLQQVPPVYSAAHVGGRRAYELARQGQDVELKPRTVHVHAIQILGYEFPHLDLEVRCGKGTYIRSLGRDLGACLGCGAYVRTLRRTHLGPFSADLALSLNEDRDTAQARLLPLAAAVHDLPKLTVSSDQARALRQGQPIRVDSLKGTVHDDTVAVFEGEERLIAIGRFATKTQMVHPEKVFPVES